MGIEAEFYWGPAHVGLKGNECADRAAKRALSMRHVADILLGKGEGKPVIKKKISEFWQKKWDEDSKGRTYCRKQNSQSTEH